MKTKPREIRFSRREYRTEYLASPEWEALRNKAFEIYGDRCGICHNRASQAHHMAYKNIYDVPPAYLMPVCGTCHRRIHAAVRAGILKIPYGGSRQGLIKGTMHALDRYEKGYSQPSKHPVTAEQAAILVNAPIHIQKQIRGLFSLIQSHPISAIEGRTLRRPSQLLRFRKILRLVQSVDHDELVKDAKKFYKKRT